MGSQDNKKKACNGAAVKELVEKTITDLRADGLISARYRAPHYGYDGYDSKQFYAANEIELCNSEKWLIFSTNSIRNDRVKESQWDAYNIMRIDGSIEKAYLVVPDEGSFEGGKTCRSKIRNGEYFTAISDILTIDEFVELVRDVCEKCLEEEAIPEYAIDYDYPMAEEVTSEDAEQPVTDEGASVVVPMLGEFVSNVGDCKNNGARNDKRGRRFEDVFAAIMENEGNLTRAQKSEPNGGYFYGLFEQVLGRLEIDPSKVETITASNHIRKLESGGNPKTDVLLGVKEKGNNAEKRYTFSLKASNKKTVSVHEYTADDFADALNPADDKLRHLLNEFQKAGSRKDMEGDDGVLLQEKLKDYRLKLDKWVLSGKTDEFDSGEIYADYLLALEIDSSIVRMNSVDEYCELREAENSGKYGFGTIFAWTYPSKMRGKKIQLKMKI